MEKQNILDLLINKLDKDDIWFTTKHDPTFHDADFYYDLDEYGDLTEKSQERVVKEICDYIGDGAIDITDAIELWIQNSFMDCSIAYSDMLRTKFKPKQVVDQIEAYETSFEMKTENAKARLKEENNKSLNLISQKFQDTDFDSDSPSGKIVIRTSELFNALSSAGYDVQVSFDNGESQSIIILGNSGGNVIITITDYNAPLRLFVSGNFELTSDILDTLKDIIDQTKSI